VEGKFFSTPGLEAVRTLVLPYIGPVTPVLSQLEAVDVRRCTFLKGEYSPTSNASCVSTAYDYEDRAALTTNSFSLPPPKTSANSQS